MLDASPAFTVDEIYQRLAGYGPRGRQNYSFRNVTVDVLLPISVFPFLMLLALRASSPFTRRRLLPVFLIALPVVYVVFDFVENATILRLLSAYPDRLDNVASTLPYSTMIKRAASLLALVLPLGLLGVRRVRKSKSGVST